VVAVKENFKSEYIINIILGKETSDIIAHQHDELETFGTGTGDEEKTWNAVLQQALISGYLNKEVENYGIIKITAAGKKFLKSPKSFKIVEDRDFDEEENEEMPMRAGGTVVVDPALFSMLKDLRKKVAKKHDLPPYVIFQDPSLEAMATTYPINIDECATFLVWVKARPNVTDRSSWISSADMWRRTRLNAPRICVCAPWLISQR
jgi:ATP-dependent DNA helicase RecQ